MACTSAPNPAPDARRLLREEVDALFSLNPDLAFLRRKRILRLAEDCPAEAFAEFADRADALVNAYLESPWKTAGQQTLGEYFAAVRSSARRLVERGEAPATILETGEDDGESAAVSHALAPLEKAGSANWCRVLQEANIPHTLSVAAEAVRNRVTEISGVLEVMFRVLYRIDARAAFQWEGAFLARHRGAVDPEVARDLLRAWRDAPDLPLHILDVILAWSTDRSLLHEWPAVVQQADRLLRGVALGFLATEEAPSDSHRRRLRMIAADMERPYPALKRWLDAAMRSLGGTVSFFLRMAEREPDGEGEHWSRAAVLRELETIESLYPNLLLLADIVLAMPDGAAEFAYSLFGFTEAGRDQWRRQVLEYAKRVIERAFLRDLRLRRSVIPTLQRLCFGDDALAFKLKGYVDFTTGLFHSVQARDAAVAELAPYYASFREQELLAQEVTRRYRRLMRVLHSDNLRRILPAEAAQRFEGSPALRDMASITASARAFLSKRRALHSPLEDVVAAEFDFTHAIRRQRAQVLRKLAADRE